MACSCVLADEAHWEAFPHTLISSFSVTSMHRHMDVHHLSLVLDPFLNENLANFPMTLYTIGPSHDYLLLSDMSML